MQDAQHGHVKDRPPKTSGAGTARPCMQATLPPLTRDRREISFNAPIQESIRDSFAVLFAELQWLFGVTNRTGW